MDNLAKVVLFPNDRDNYERCNLTSLLFKDVDYSMSESPVSFFRSDFSRSQFNNCTFYRNAFGRADFIDVYVITTEFTSVDFGSCMMKNAMFEKTHFYTNRYHGVAIQNSYFKKCTFRDESFVTNMFQTTFEQCTFINCKFEKSSLDHISFLNCEFIKVDISECWAENLRFDSCTLRDVYLGVSLWPSYLYRDTDISNFGFKYRGNVVDPWTEEPETFLDNLISRGRLFEYLNALIIGRKMLQKDIVSALSEVLHLAAEQPILIRKNNVTRILEMLLFYSNFSAIDFFAYLKMIQILKNFNWTSFSFEEQLTYGSLLYKIEQNFAHFNFSIHYLLEVPTSQLCIATYHLNFENSSDAKEYLNHIYTIANEECGGVFSSPLMEVIDEKAGSVILTVAAIASLTLLISYVAKKVAHNLSSIQIEGKVKAELAKEIENSQGSISKLQKVCSLAKTYNLLSCEEDGKMIEKLSSEITKGEIIDIILKFLF